MVQNVSLPRSSRRRSLPAFLALAVVLAFAVVGCSSSSSGGAKSTTTLAPEEIKLPMAQVRALLPQVVSTGNAAAAASTSGDYTTAKTAADAMEVAWKKVEGTVKDRDADAYVAIEDAQARIHNGVDDKQASAVTAGAKDQVELVQKFLQNHPA